MSPIQYEFQCKACSLSFDTLNRKPRVLVPCGHSVCELCSQNLKNCIECNQIKESDIPNSELIKLLNSNSSLPSAPPFYLVAINENEPFQSTAVNNSTTTTVHTHNTSFSNNLRGYCSSLSEQFYDLSVKRKRIIIFLISFSNAYFYI